MVGLRVLRPIGVEEFRPAGEKLLASGLDGQEQEEETTSKVLLTTLQHDRVMDLHGFQNSFHFCATSKSD